MPPRAVRSHFRGEGPTSKWGRSKKQVLTFLSHCAAQGCQEPFPRGRSPGGKEDLPQTPSTPSPTIVPPSAVRGHSSGEGPTPKWGRSQKQVLTFPSHCASQCYQRPFPWGRSHTKMGKVSKTSLDLPQHLCLPVLSEAIPVGKVPRGKSRPSPNAIDTFPSHCASQCRQRPFPWGRSPGGKEDLPQTPSTPSPAIVPPSAVRGHSRGEGPQGEKKTFPKHHRHLPQHLCLPGPSEAISVGMVPGGKRRPSPNAIDTFPNHCASQCYQRPFPWGRSPGGKADLPQMPSTPSPALVPPSAIRGHSRGEGPQGGKQTFPKCHLHLPQPLCRPGLSGAISVGKVPGNGEVLPGTGRFCRGAGGYS